VEQNVLATTSVTSPVVVANGFYLMHSNSSLRQLIWTYWYTQMQNHKIIKQSSWSVLSSNKLRWYIQQLLRHDATIDTSPSRLPWHTAYITPHHIITLHTNIIWLSWLLSTVLYVLCEYCQNCSLVLVVCVAFYNCTIIWTAHGFGLPDLA